MALRQLATTFGRQMRVAQAAPSTSFTARSPLMSMLRSFATVAENAKYAESHEYAEMSGETATVGISDHAQEELGDIVFVELPSVGDEVTQGETFGVVESVKAASDVYSPVTGEVIEVNEALQEEPAKVNQDAFGEGWLMKVKVSDPATLDNLMDAKKYEEFCDN